MRLNSLIFQKIQNIKNTSLMLFIVGFGFGVFANRYFSRYLSGYLFSERNLTLQTNEQTHILNPDANIISKHTQKDPFQVLIHTSPACTSCEITETLRQKLVENKIQHKFIFQPLSLPECALMPFLSDNLEAYQALSANQDKWLTSNSISDALLLLSNKNLIKVDAKNYAQMLLKETAADLSAGSDVIYSAYNTALMHEKLFGIKGTPAVTVAFTIIGEISWQTLRSIRQDLMHHYNRLLTQQKIMP